MTKNKELARAGAAGSPVILALYLTNKCNLRCDYCFAVKGRSVMDFRLARKAIDSFAAGGRGLIPTFLGGEPLVAWPLVKRIADYAAGRGVRRFNLATNGLLLDAGKMEYFSKRGFTVQLSVDGIGPAQDASRKRPGGGGSFAAVERALDLLLAQAGRVPFELRVSLTCANVQHLARSVRFFVDKGVRANRINVMPVISGPWGKKEFAQLARQVRLIGDYYGELGIPPNIFINECLDGRSTRAFSLSDDCSCDCGSRVFCVDFKGKVYPCFIPAGLSEEQKAKFSPGDLDSGKPPAFACGARRNAWLGCPVWTTLYGGRAAAIYEKIYRLWSVRP